MFCPFGGGDSTTLAFWDHQIPIHRPKNYARGTLVRMRILRSLSWKSVCQNCIIYIGHSMSELGSRWSSYYRSWIILPAGFFFNLFFYFHWNNFKYLFMTIANFHLLLSIVRTMSECGVHCCQHEEGQMGHSIVPERSAGSFLP